MRVPNDDGCVLKMGRCKAQQKTAWVLDWFSTGDRAFPLFLERALVRKFLEAFWLFALLPLCVAFFPAFSLFVFVFLF